MFLIKQRKIFYIFFFLVVFIKFFIQNVYAKFPIQQLSQVSSNLSKKDQAYSPIHGVIYVEGGMIYYDYHFASKQSSKNRLLKLLFHQTPSGIMPSQKGHMVAMHLNSQLIGSLIYLLKNNQWSEEKGLDIILQNKYFLNSVRLDRPNNILLQKNIRKFIRLLTDGEDNYNILLALLWYKLKDVNEYDEYYKALQTLPSFKIQAIDQATIEALELIQKKFMLLPFDITKYKDMVFNDCAENSIRNILRVIFYNEGRYYLRGLSSYKKMNSLVKNYFWQYNDDHDQFSQKSRDEWTNIVSNINNINYKINTKDVKCEITGCTAGGAYKNILKILKEFFDVDSIKEWNELLHNCGFKNIDISSDVDFKGFGRIIIKNTLGEYHWIFTPGHFKVQAVMNLEQNNKYIDLMNFIEKNKAYSLLSIMPNTIEKFDYILKQMNNDIDENFIQYIYPAQNDSDWVIIAKYLSQSKNFPLNYLMKIFDKIQLSQDKLDFFKAIAVEKRDLLVDKIMQADHNGYCIPLQNIYLNYSSANNNNKHFFDALAWSANICTPDGVNNSIHHYLLSEALQYKNPHQGILDAAREYINDFIPQMSVVDYRNEVELDTMYNVFIIDQKLLEHGYPQHIFRMKLREKIKEININFESSLINSLPFAAAKANNLSMLMYLYNLGADPYYENKNTPQVILAAIMGANIKIIKYLINKYKFDLNHFSHNHPSPLAWPIYNQKYSLLDFLLSFDLKKTSFKQTDHDGNTILQLLINKQQYRLINKIIKMGKNLDINHLNNAHQSALHLAVIKEDEKILKILLDQVQTDIQLMNDQGLNALMLAKNSANINIQNILIEKGASINYSGFINQRNQYKRLIYFASKYNDTQILNECFKYKINLNRADQYGDAPIHTMVSYKSNDVLSLLLRKPFIQIQKLDKSSFTPLSLAIIHNNTQGALAIMSHKSFNINDKKNALNRGILLQAIGTDNYEIVQKIIRLKPQVSNVATFSHYSDETDPIHVAAKYAGIDVMKILLDWNQINPKALNKKGKNAYMIAKEESNHREKEQIYKMLKI